MVQFDVYDLFRDISLEDDFLWLQDIPLCQSCDGYRGGTEMFSPNLSISDWSAFCKLMQPKGAAAGMYKFTKALMENQKKTLPAFKEDIESLFFGENRYLVEVEKGLAINYARTYDFLKFMVDLKDVAYEELQAFLATHKDEIEKGFYNELVKVIKADELFVRVAIMTNTLYYIFDKDEPLADHYIALFVKNNKWVFNTKVAKFDDFFAYFKGVIEGYVQTKNFKRSELLSQYKKLAEYRRTLFKKYNQLGYTFYLDFVD
ncbi:MAG: hypothetical protein K6E59_00025 [Bacilli bacterium]|nr:hypothetical protein [Bacilli bacterium]